jgi:hypothetical protein
MLPEKEQRVFSHEQKLQPDCAEGALEVVVVDVVDVVGLVVVVGVVVVVVVVVVVGVELVVVSVELERRIIAVAGDRVTEVTDVPLAVK